MPMTRCRCLLAALLMLGPVAMAQEENDAAAQGPVEEVAPVSPGAVESVPADEPPHEVTIGPTAPGTDPLADRDRPSAEPAQPREAVEQERMILGIPESELKIDPRTLGIAPGEPMPPLLREGEFIRSRDARLIPTGERGYAVVILDPPADAEPDAKRTAMIVAPNRMLESMEALHKDRGDNLRFTLTGQVHTYRGVNYLMITSQPRPWLTGQKVEQPELAGQGTDVEQGGDTAGDPAQPGDEPTADDVLDQLLGERTKPAEGLDPADAPEPVHPDPASDDLPTIDPRKLIQGVAPDLPEPKLYEEGSFIINRSARLIRSGDGAHPILIFDADDAQSPEPPMIVQNCKLLEEMEAIIETHGDHVPFIVTGQVQTYRGTNYLLPSIGKLEFDYNNE